MRYVAAYLLATLGGNDQPSDADIKNILKSVGIECDGARIKGLLSELSGKDINVLISEGYGKLASMPAAGAVVAGVAAAAPAASGAPSAAVAVQKKEEPKKEESDEDMGFGLFD